MLLEAIASILLIGAAYKLDKKSQKSFENLEAENQRLLDKQETTTPTTLETLDKETTPVLSERAKELLNKLYEIHHTLDTLTSTGELQGSALRTRLFLPFDTIMRQYYAEFAPHFNKKNKGRFSAEFIEVMETINKISPKADKVSPYSSQAYYFLNVTEKSLSEQVDTLHTLICPFGHILSDEEGSKLVVLVFEFMNSVLSEADETLTNYQKQKLTALLDPTQTTIVDSIETLLEDTPSTHSPFEEAPIAPVNPFGRLEADLANELAELDKKVTVNSKELHDTENPERIMQIPIHVQDEQSGPTDSNIPPSSVITNSTTISMKKEDTSN